jgi:hypothetical protein
MVKAATIPARTAEQLTGPRGHIMRTSAKCDAVQLQDTDFLPCLADGLRSKRRFQESKQRNRRPVHAVLIRSGHNLNGKGSLFVNVRGKCPRGCRLHQICDDRPDVFHVRIVNSRAHMRDRE